ncbi:transcriptional regulator-domain-containing protein [Diplogelasinospora grovesii]|uniref:Transcriptional regulator-domain-containing protein n=1 Tax=Diplogelasinospora grovesii TaxID=303347 RepID=A0AAN6N384_9PEZI|nr:transcriptional regulator-domain-containing protein [Diplogelasinospora grovesii]
MASLARGASSLARFAPKTALSTVCAQCRRTFISSAVLQSGHNKWSKIRHDKAVKDNKKNATRTQFTKNITLYSKLYGANPDDNPQLANVLLAAKKAGVPKAVIETAIARGQGKSSDGAALESLTFEAMLPPSVAVIVDFETESKLRALQDLNQMVKKAKGSTSSSKFFFSRVGRVVFERNPENGLGVDDIMDDAIEAGAEDLENDADGNIVVWTQPTQTTQICKAVGDKFGLRVLSSDIIWSANEDTKVKLDSSQELTNFLDLLVWLREYPDVQAVYSNAAKGGMTDEEWAKLTEHLDT